MPRGSDDLRDLAEALGILWEQLRPTPPERWTQGTPDATASEGPDPYGNPDPEWLRIDWREHLRSVDLGALGHVNHVDLGPRGEATPLLLIHGLSGGWQDWLETIPPFARSRRVVALDLPGFGRSPMPSEGRISIPAYAEVLLAFADALGLARCAVVGSSMGGFVAVEAASTAPGRFTHLGLVSAAGISHAAMRREPVEAAGRLALAAAPLAGLLQGAALRRPKLRAGAFKAIFRRPELLRPELLYENLLNGARPPAFLDALGAVAGYDILDRLPAVEVPALIVWGRNDRIVPPRDAVTFAQLLPNSRSVVFNECGHLPMLERPVRFNRVLKAFLAG